MQRKRKAETSRCWGVGRTWTQREGDGKPEREKDRDPERGRWRSREERTEAQRLRQGLRKEIRERQGREKERDRMTFTQTHRNQQDRNGVKETTEDKNDIQPMTSSNWRRRRGIEKWLSIYGQRKINQDGNLGPTAYVSPLPQAGLWAIYPHPQTNCLHPLVCLCICVGWGPKPRPGVGSFTPSTHWFHTHFPGHVSTPKTSGRDSVPPGRESWCFSQAGDRGGGAGDSFSCHCLREPPEAAGSCSSHHNPVLPLTPVQPQTRVLKCLYLQGRAAAAPEFA